MFNVVYYLWLNEELRILIFVFLFLLIWVWWVVRFKVFFRLFFFWLGCVLMFFRLLFLFFIMIFGFFRLRRRFMILWSRSICFCGVGMSLFFGFVLLLLLFKLFFFFVVYFSLVDGVMWIESLEWVVGVLRVFVRCVVMWLCIGMFF